MKVMVDSLGVHLAYSSTFSSPDTVMGYFTGCLPAGSARQPTKSYPARTGLPWAFTSASVTV